MLYLGSHGRAMTDDLRGAFWGDGVMVRFGADCEVDGKP